jgi:hypothetical protein
MTDVLDRLKAALADRYTIVHTFVHSIILTLHVEYGEVAALMAVVVSTGRGAVRWVASARR